MTPSAYERQPTDRRLAGRFKTPPREDYRKCEVQSRDMQQPHDVPLMEKGNKQATELPVTNRKPRQRSVTLAM